MSFMEFMSRVRYWDNKAAKWMTRHFYLLFFEVILVLIFFILFVLFLKTMDASVAVNQNNVFERLLMIQSFGFNLIILLLLLNSFWMLYIFNSILRIRTLLKELNFNLTRKFRSNR